MCLYLSRWIALAEKPNMAHPQWSKHGSVLLTYMILFLVREKGFKDVRAICP